MLEGCGLQVFAIGVVGIGLWMVVRIHDLTAKVRELTVRLDELELESSSREPRREGEVADSRPAAADRKIAPRPAHPPAPTPGPEPVSAPAPVPAPARVVAPPPARAVPPAPALPEPPLPRPAAPAASAAETPAVPPPRPPAPTPPVRRPVARDADADAGPAARRAGSGVSVEEVLGTRVFLRVGVAIVVLGVVFFLGYALKILGPGGKVATGYLVGAVALAGGLYAERWPTYRTFGRGILAGAWAILYFVTFALHWLPAARILDSTPAAAVALLVAAGAAVAFSLRYRHEWTTVASFLLIYLSLFVAATQLEATFNSIATAVTAAGLAVLAWRLGWRRLLGLGTPASWAAMGVWLVPHVLSLRGAEAGGAAPGVLLGIGATWVVLSLPLVAPRRAPSGKDLWHPVALLGGLPGVALAVVYVRAAAPGGEGWVAAVSGLLYLAASWRFGVAGRRPLCRLATTIAVGLIALAPALFLGVASRWLPVFWLLELELLLLAGVLLAERYFRGVAYLGFALVFVDLVFAVGIAGPEMRLPLLLFAAALSLVDTALLRTRWRRALVAEEVPAVAYAFSGAGAVLVLLLLWRELPPMWVASAVAAAALVWLAAGIRFEQRDLLVAGGLLSIAAIGALAIKTWAVAPDSQAVVPRVVPSLLTALAAEVGYALVRRRAGRGGPGPTPPRSVLVDVQALVGLVAVVSLVLYAVAAPWRAAVLLLLVPVHLVPALRRGWPELLYAACGLSALGAYLVVVESWTVAGGILAIPPAAVSARTVAPTLFGALALYLSQLLIRRIDRPRIVSAERVPMLAGSFGLLAVAGLVALVQYAVPAAWQAPTALALAALHLALALRSGWVELFAEGGLWTLVGLGFLVLASWPLEGVILGLPARAVSVVAAALFLYVSQALFQRRAGRPDNPAAGWSGAAGLHRLAGGYLTLATVVVAALVKSEALAHDTNLLVALAWGLAGLLYLEVGRLLTATAWYAHGQALVAAGTVHLFLVNFLQDGRVAGMSLRLLTVLPFLALLAYVYLTWPGATARLALPDWARRVRIGYQYAMVAVAVTLLLCELARAWVAPAWAALAFAVLLLWRRRGDRHWLVAATAVAIAAAGRGIAGNLVVRDEVLALRTNLIALPLTCVALVAGYVLIRALELRAAGHEGGGEGAAAPAPAGRLAWLLSAVVLLTAFVWVESSGTVLTVWLSVEGLAMVALGFPLRERISRLLGLGLLSACVLKLFFYDLRGLTGLARIASFIVLGLVLIAVSYAYTRFRERLRDLW